jgi:hypothetical protein
MDDDWWCCQALLCESGRFPPLKGREEISFAGSQLFGFRIHTQNDRGPLAATKFATFLFIAENLDMTDKPAGWYEDPDRPAPAMRWWDGTSWTEARHDPSLPPPPSPKEAVPAGPPKTSDWVLSVVLLIFCWILGVIFLVTNPRFTRNQKIWIAACTVGLLLAFGAIGEAAGSSTRSR